MHHIHVVIRNMVLQNSIRPEPESYRKIFRQVKPGSTSEQPPILRGP
jgi:hypothetical protein